jgi:hypothetical protein
MKKIYSLVFCTATLLSIVNAQTSSDLQFQKGDKLLGGSLSVNASDPQGAGSNTSLSVSPSIGFFTKPNRLTGFSLFYSTPSLSQSGNFGFGASVYRQYWNSLGKNFYFILQGGVVGSFNKNTDYNSSQLGLITSQIKTYTASVNVAPGFAYRVNRRLVLDAFLANFGNLYYSYNDIESQFNGASSGKSHRNNFGFNSSLNGLSLSNIQIGFRYIFK